MTGPGPVCPLIKSFRVSRISESETPHPTIHLTFKNEEMREQKSAGALDEIVPFLAVVTRAINRKLLVSKIACSGHTIVRVLPGATVVAPCVSRRKRDRENASFPAANLSDGGM